MADPIVQHQVFTEGATDAFLLAAGLMVVASLVTWIFLTVKHQGWPPTARRSCPPGCRPARFDDSSAVPLAVSAGGTQTNRRLGTVTPERGSDTTTTRPRGPSMSPLVGKVAGPIATALLVTAGVVVLETATAPPAHALAPVNPVTINVGGHRANSGFLVFVEHDVMLAFRVPGHLGDGGDLGSATAELPDRGNAAGTSTFTDEGETSRPRVSSAARIHGTATGVVASSRAHQGGRPATYTRTRARRRTRGGARLPLTAPRQPLQRPRGSSTAAPADRPPPSRTSRART